MVRVLFYLLPVLMLSIVSVMLTFLIRNTDLKSEWRLMTEPAIQTTGIALDIEEAKGSRDSITYVYTYEFKPVGREGPNDPPVKGISYAGERVAAPGQAVHIDYLQADHRISRIEGCRVNFAPWQTLVVIPFLGVIMAILPWGMVSYKKRSLQRLITLGVTASALIEKIKPGAKGSLVVEVRYRVDGTEITAKTNTGGGKQLKEWLMSLRQAGQTVLILVDPEKPKHIFMLELLLRSRKVNAPGSIP